MCGSLSQLEDLFSRFSDILFRIILPNLSWSDICALRQTSRQIRAAIDVYSDYFCIWQGPLSVGQYGSPMVLQYYLNSTFQGKRLGIQTGFLIISGCLRRCEYDLCSLVFCKLTNAFEKQRKTNQALLMQLDADLCRLSVLANEAAAIEWYCEKVMPHFASVANRGVRMLAESIHFNCTDSLEILLQMPIVSDMEKREQVLAACSYGSLESFKTLIRCLSLTPSDLTPEEARAINQHNQDQFVEWIGQTFNIDHVREFLIQIENGGP